MFDGLFQPAHLLVAVILCVGLWLFVRIIRNAAGRAKAKKAAK